MTPEQFNAALLQKQGQLKNYANNELPQAAGNITLRFIDGNFRAQGWQGRSFQPWKPVKGKRGSILINRGKLRRSTTFTTGPGTIRLINSAPYAKAHNQGFKGTVTVAEHTRRNFKSQKVKTGKLTKTGREQTRTVHTVTGVSTVKTHTRKMNLPKRQFFPTSPTDSPKLSEAIEREIERGLKKIFEP